MFGIGVVEILVLLLAIAVIAAIVSSVGKRRQ
jgi:hypothetical protein